MERLPLEQRLKMAEMQDPNLLKITKMKISDFLSALTDIIGEDDAASIINEVNEHISEPDAQAIGIRIAATAGLFEDCRETCNYALLVEAFSKIHDMKWGKSK